MFAASKTAKAASAAAPTDPQFNYVTMLLHGDGTNGAQNNTFVDSSTNNFTITRNGNTTQGTFSPYGANWANYFDGDGDGLTVASSSGFAFGTGDFTYEGWYYSLDTGSSLRGMFDTRLTSNSTAGVLLREDSSGFLVYINNTTLFTASGRVANTWQHIALVRQSGTVRLYINGVQANSASSSTNMTDNNCRISGFVDTQASPYGYFGYISNARVVKGTCLYPSGTSFTPSTTPLTSVSGTSLITCQSNRFIDTSSNALAITVNGTPSVQRFSPFNATSAYSTSVIGGSGYFDGSGDYLRVAYNSNLYPATTLVDYTVECWVYPTAGTGGLQFILGTNNTTVADWTFTQDAGQWGFTLSGTGGNAGTVIANQWTHLAMTRNGLTVNGYVNGVRVLTTTASTQSNNGLPLNIGMRNGSDRAFTGYITDIRIVNGTAVYTGASYTVPTAPLTAISNTQFLSNNTNAGILDNAMMNDLETVGNAQISTSVKKYGTGSISFDGTGDGLQAIGTPNTAFGTGDFTVEFWIYLNANTGSFKKFVELGTSGACFTIETQGTNNVLNVTDLNTTVFITSSTALSLTTWTHVAVTRSGTSMKLFQNGTQVGSATNSTNFANSGNVYIGQSNSGQAVNCYMDDLRITKGYARYTSNFTPPTQAFPNN